VTAHLSDDRLREFLDGTLTPSDLLAVDDHLSECGDCRARAADFGHADQRIAAVVDDLSQAEPARPIVRSRWAYYYAAAAVILLAVAGLVTMRMTGSRRATNDVSTDAALDTLSADERQSVGSALEFGRVHVPERVEALRGRNETLMGPGGENAFRVTEPLGTLTVTDRPVFRWQPLPGATEYAVAVFDANLNPIVASGFGPDTTWTPPSPLPRGQMFAWQVTARAKGATTTVPAPPAPPARFGVLDEPTANHLERLAADHPDSPLVLGILYAEAGALADAERYLKRVPESAAEYRRARAILDQIGSRAAER
jgi:hypothetical protein